MPFPTVAATATTNAGSANPYVINLPSGIVAGDLLIVIYGSDNNTTVTTPAGWTAPTDVTGDPNFYIMYRVADGSEGSTVSLTRSTGQPSGAVSYRITGYTGVPEVATATNGSSANPDSGNLAPSWGTKDTLWLSCFAVNSASGSSITSPPANYSNTLTNDNFRVGSAQRANRASSEDPGSFTLAGSETWRAQTVGIQGKDNPYVHVPWQPPSFEQMQVSA